MPPLGIANVSAGPLSKSTAWSRLRGPLASVGTGVCKYGATLDYATPNGVTGFMGPPASALRQPTNWYVRIGGSNNNGGSSASLTPERTGTDGDTTSLTTFVSASANFTTADVGKGICVRTGIVARRFKITAVINSTTVRLDHSDIGGGASQTWALGGAWADLRAAIADLNVTAAGIRITPAAPGDTIYVGGGTYRQVYQMGADIVNVFNGVLNIVGDVTGQYTGDAGMVQITAYTTNDKTAPSSTTLLDLNGKSNLSFSNILFVGGNASIVGATTLTSQNMTFRDCAFINLYPATGARIFNTACGYQVPYNWVIDRCDIIDSSATSPIFFNPNGGAQAFDCGVFITNCRIWFFGGNSAVFFLSANAPGNVGGLRVRSCMIFCAPGGNGVMSVASASTTFPCSVTNCQIYCGISIGFVASPTNSIVEDYNLICTSGTVRSGVAVGAHTIADGSYASLFSIGQERIWGGLLRPFGEPMAGSPLLGFGNDGSQSSYDLYNRPRPAGGAALPYPAVGALERGNTAAQATSPAPPSGTYDWQFTGPAFQEFLLPVDATATAVSIKVQRDSVYSPYPGGTLPALQILANPRLGIPAQTVVDTGVSGGWNTLAAAAFTPTASGWITVRIASYDGTGASVVSFANFSLTPVASPTFVSDSFTDTNGTFLESHVGETGAIWTNNPGADAGSEMVIGNGRLRSGGSGGTVPIYYSSGTPGSADYDVVATFRKLDTTSTVIAVYGRMDTAAFTGYRIAASDFSGNWLLSKFVAGAQTDLGNYVGSFTVGQDYNVRLVMRGSAISVYIDGVLRISATDSAITAAGRVGVSGFDSYAIGSGWQVDSISGVNP